MAQEEDIVKNGFENMRKNIRKYCPTLIYGHIGKYLNLVLSW